LPVELHGVVQSMGQSLWETAQQLANESLDAAKVAFETEKSDLIQLSAEQSEAASRPRPPSWTPPRRALPSWNAKPRPPQQQQATAQELDETRRARLAAEQDAALAKQRAEEIERRAAELRAELDHAHAEAETAAAQAKATADSLRADADRLRTERDKAQQRQELAEAEGVKLAASLAAAQGETAKAQAALAGVTAKAEAAEQAHADQRKRAAEEVHRSAERMTKAETERDKARSEAATAREEAAALRGELEATKTQNAGLLAALKPSLPRKARAALPRIDWRQLHDLASSRPSPNRPGQRAGFFVPSTSWPWPCPGWNRRQGRHRRPHAERSPQGEHRTGEDGGRSLHP
jgi:DNA repair exonuclease SbcCD ATPase subunit